MATIDVEFEHDVLAAAMQQREFLRAALPVLERHHFSSRALAWVWGVLQRTYQEHREVATARVYRATMERDYPDEEEREYMVDVLLQLKRRKVTAPRSALEQIRNFVRMVAIREAASGALDGLDRDDLDAAEAAIAGGAEAGRKAGMLAEPTSWAKDAHVRLAAYKEAKTKGVVGVRTALPTLDRLINGRMGHGKLGLIIATTNVGKSTFAVASGYAPLVHSGAVISHTVTEETTEEAAARYDARLTGIPRNRLLGGKLTTEDETRYTEAFARRGKDLDRVYLQELPPGARVGEIRAMAERARSQHPERPLVLVVDTSDNLRSGLPVKDKRNDASEVAWALKGISLDPDLAPCCVWAVVHAPAAFEGRRLSSKAVSESYDKARAADLMIGLVEGEEESEEGKDKLVEVQVVKNRLGAVKHYTIHARGDMGCCVFTEIVGHAEA